MRFKIQAAILDYLDTKGYPNMSDEVIIQELPNIWKYLESKKLIQKGMRYDIFVQHAYTRFQLAKVRASNEDIFEQLRRGYRG